MATEQDLGSQILSNPFFWLLLMMVVGFFILRLLLNRRQTDPSTQAWWGEKVRKEKVKEQLDRRTKFWGITSSLHLYKGLNKVGRIVKYAPERKVEIVEEKQKDGTYKFIQKGHAILYTISFRQYGFMAWLKNFFGWGREHLILDPSCVKVDEKKGIFVIDPMAVLLDDSGVWTISKKIAYDFIDDVMLKKDLENIKGYTSDYLRRLSNENPGQAMVTERTSHEAELDEKKRKGLRSSYISG